MPDACSLDGAKALAEKIERYWRSRGFAGIETWLEKRVNRCGKASGHHGLEWDVRTNLVNGFPPKEKLTDASSDAC